MIDFCAGVVAVISTVLLVGGTTVLGLALVRPPK